MKKEFNPMPHTISDPIVMDAIKLINLVKHVRNIKGHIGGGMAVGAYIPKENQRPTIDLDFALLWGGTTEEFRYLVEPMTLNLYSKGYESNVQKRDKTFEISVQSGNHDSLLIQHQRRNKENFERNKSSLEREVSNQRIVTKDGLSFAVMSPEDLILHKLSRLFTFSKVYDLGIPTRMKTENMLRAIKLFKKEYNLNSLKEKDAAIVRMYFDSYDIKHLAKYVGLNQRYFEEAAKDWNNKFMDEDSAKKLIERMDIYLK